jgi:polyisoprenyl-phosphate glycosyltransferase
MKKLISIVIPAYNEEDVLDELKRRLQKVMNTCNNYNFEVIIVENGSRDSSFEKLLLIHTEDPRFKIVQLSRNFECDGGIGAGLQYIKGDAAVIMNADLQDPPEMIPSFIELWENGNEIVYGIIEKREGVPVLRKFLSRAAYIIISKLSNNMIPENVSDFRLVDKRVYSVINKMPEKNKFLRGLIVWTGFKQTGIPYKRPQRFAGSSKADFITVWKVAMNGIFSFSYFPLKIATGLGFMLSLISFVIAFFEIFFFLKDGREVPGFTTLILTVLFCFGVLFFLLGIFGKYIERIYEEVKQRPNYVVKDTFGFE